MFMPNQNKISQILEQFWSQEFDGEVCYLPIMCLKTYGLKYILPNVLYGHKFQSHTPREEHRLKVIRFKTGKATQVMKR